MADITLSVFIPNYNHGKYIGRAIEAIVSQSKPPDELIILDDGSTDNSVSIITAYAKSYPFIKVLCNERNTGAIAAMQRFSSVTTGDYIYGAAADDYILPGFFEKAMDMIKRYPQSGIVCGQVVHVDEKDQECSVNEVKRWQHSRFVSPEDFLHDYLDVESPGHSLSVATIYKRDAFEEVGGFREELGSWCDTFAARAIALRYGVCYLAERCAVFTNIPTSFSQERTRHPKQLLDIIARAAWLMRSPEFRDSFPEAHVREWQARYRRHVIWSNAEKLKQSFDSTSQIYFQNLLGNTWVEKCFGWIFLKWINLEKYVWALGLRGMQHLFYNGDISCYLDEHTHTRTTAT